MEMKIDIAGHGPIPGTNMVQFALSIDFDGPIETMTITVTVPNQANEGASRAAAISRAKELARLFAARAQA